MKLKHILITTFVTLVIFVIGCKENETGIPALLGTWVAPELGQTELTFLPSEQFICKTNILSLTDSTNYSIIKGTVKVNGNKLELNITEVESSNIFYPDKQPVIIKQSGSLFGECTYMVKGDRLELNYTTYPADAPLQTRLILYKKR